MKENPWFLPGVINHTRTKAASTYFGVKTPVFRDNITTQIKAAAQSRMASGGPVKTAEKQEAEGLAPSKIEWGLTGTGGTRGGAGDWVRVPGGGRY